MDFSFRFWIYFGIVPLLVSHLLNGLGVRSPHLGYPSQEVKPGLAQGLGGPLYIHLCTLASY